MVPARQHRAPRARFQATPFSAAPSGCTSATQQHRTHELLPDQATAAISEHHGQNKGFTQGRAQPVCLQTPCDMLRGCPGDRLSWTEGHRLQGQPRWAQAREEQGSRSPGQDQVTHRAAGAGSGPQAARVGCSSATSPPCTKMIFNTPGTYTTQTPGFSPYFCSRRQYNPFPTHAEESGDFTERDRMGLST